MRKKHDYSANNKMVAGPHNFTESHGSAEPAGGGAQGPQMPMFCNGGKAYSDGGYTGAPSKMDMAIDSVKHVFGADNPKAPAERAGISTGNSDAPYQGTGGKEREDTVMAAADKAVNGG